MKRLLERVLNGAAMEEGEAADFIAGIGAGQVAPEVAASVLSVLRFRGESPAEVRGCAQGLLAMARPAGLDSYDGMIDTCGTGGDGSGSLNISTAVALVVAGCGLPVAKHGNRSISSRSGSADVLLELGVPFQPELVSPLQAMQNAGFSFLYAPYFHPAMANIMPVRRALGVRTVFNMIGPLCNPAKPRFQVIGAFSLKAAKTIAHSLCGVTHLERAFVVHGAQGWDEATPMGPFTVFDVRDGRVEQSVRDPLDFGFERCSAMELKGGNASYNAMRMRRALSGRERGAHADALALGVALALEVADEAVNFSAALSLARDALTAGLGEGVLQRLRNLKCGQVING